MFLQPSQHHQRYNITYNKSVDQHNELDEFSKLIERLFKRKIALNSWKQPCPENNKFDRFLNSYPNTLKVLP